MTSHEKKLMAETQMPRPPKMKRHIRNREKEQAGAGRTCLVALENVSKAVEPKRESLEDFVANRVESNNPSRKQNKPCRF